MAEVHLESDAFADYERLKAVHAILQPAMRGQERYYGFIFGGAFSSTIMYLGSLFGVFIMNYVTVATRLKFLPSHSVQLDIKINLASKDLPQ